MLTIKKCINTCSCLLNLLMIISTLMYQWEGLYFSNNLMLVVIFI